MRLSLKNEALPYGILDIFIDDNTILFKISCAVCVAEVKVLKSSDTINDVKITTSCCNSSQRNHRSISIF